MIVQSARRTAAAPAVRSFRTPQPTRRPMELSLFYFEQRRGRFQGEIPSPLGRCKVCRHARLFGRLDAGAPLSRVWRVVSQSVGDGRGGCRGDRAHAHPCGKRRPAAAEPDSRRRRMGGRRQHVWRTSRCVVRLRMACERFRFRAREICKTAKAITFRDVDVVRRLWRGESVSVENGAGGVVDVTDLSSPGPIRAAVLDHRCRRSGDVPHGR